MRAPCVRVSAPVTIRTATPAAGTRAPDAASCGTQSGRVLHGAIDVVTAAGCIEITLDFTELSSVDHSATWCIAQASSALGSDREQLTVANPRDAIQAALGDMHSRKHTRHLSLPRRSPSPPLSNTFRLDERGEP